MLYPPLIYYDTIDEYRDHFKKIYCTGNVISFDGITVRFKNDDFNHAFYESVKSKDDTFSPKRAERIDWIKAALSDPDSERFIGWDNVKKRYDGQRRVTIVMKDYVVVIAILKNGSGKFITAYVADSETTLSKIRKGTLWK